MQRTATRVVKGLAGVSSIALLGGGLFVYTDDGAKRAVTFWSRVLPAYAHYKFTEWRMVGKDSAEKQLAYGALHDRYAPVCEELILNLRGFFIKIAQLGSTRDDFIPEQYLKFFRTVQDDVPPSMSEQEVRDVVTSAIGRPLEQVFRSFEPKAFAAATIGQVHKARLQSGQEVAVKVQYPGCEKQFRSDIALAIQFCHLAFPQHVAPLTEFQNQFASEFDYTKEAALLAEIGSNITPVWGDKVKVPAPVLDLCRKNVLVMELLRGVKLTDAIIKQYTKLANAKGMSFEEFRKEQLAKGPGPSAERMKYYIMLMHCQVWAKNALIACWNGTLGWLSGLKKSYIVWEEPLNIPAILNLLVDVHSYELFVNGTFNADPHPGNVMLLEDGRLGLVDYGQVGRMARGDIVKYARIIVALADEQREEVARLLVEDMGYVTRCQNFDHIWRWAAFYMDRDSADVTDGRMPMTFMEHLDNIVPFSYVPPNFVMCVRLALILRSFGHAFGYPLSIAHFQRPYALRVLEQIDCGQACAKGISLTTSE